MCKPGKNRHTSIFGAPGCEFRLPRAATNDIFGQIITGHPHVAFGFESVTKGPAESRTYPINHIKRTHLIILIGRPGKDHAKQKTNKARHFLRPAKGLKGMGRPLASALLLRVVTGKTGLMMMALPR